MRLVNDFSVDAPLDAAWAALTDIPAVVACIPGAELDGRDGDDYHARVAVKVGPVGMTLAGTASVVSRDDIEHEMVVRGQAHDRRGNGSAEATVTMVARPSASAPDRSDVTVVTELELGGRIAQFGSGVISQVANRILAQFVRKLNTLMTGADESVGQRRAPVVAHRRPEAADRRALAMTVLAGALLGLAIGRTAQRLR
ncbi:SRPBCC family protein [Mycolicibacterium sp. S2-37]|uniref:SRPBCC family protein n=1 Tax=Mycolicibacterium sp. S2-37 TaxID=2810297 RepID=UPI001A949A76|nr:SRPBCC family protein [Mycolicibacterium sp. S2-37]MBO0677213.1 SRPBCC family protein [Mycolicibacterium sp. S2-37]